MCYARRAMRPVFLAPLLGLAGCALLGGRQPAEPVPLFEDLGTHHHPIATSSPLAQRYFDQGLRLVYAFNHDEAIRAFKEAARLDPDCAMAWWGVAYALGPNYNMPLDAEHERAAREAMARAQALARRAPASEQAYIAAVALRYGEGERKALDRAFADAMHELATRFPDDLDAATLYAESLMVLRPWALWTADGRPEPGTPEILTTLEDVLAKNPDHPGANHYYIHAIEASPHPERALPSAGRLPALAPGAGHLVHMPSHVYMRLGRYADASEANTRAIAADQTYIARDRPQGVYPMMYYPHNVHFLWAAATMEGRSADAIRAAREVTGMAAPEMVRQMPVAEYFVPTAWLALARFGRWTELLAEPAPPGDLRWAHGMWAYARGLALAATGRLGEAAAMTRIVDFAARTVPEDRIIADNQPAREHLRLAAANLRGEIAARSGRHAAAIAALRDAVRIQDALPYTEPPPWHYPVRQSLGEALLAARRPAEAEAVFREDLARNPENGWSLFGLARALRARGRDASAVERRFAEAWSRADVTLRAARF
jgi:tetratricopeptide (TPR) repeat protein